MFAIRVLKNLCRTISADAVEVGIDSGSRIEIDAGMRATNNGELPSAGDTSHDRGSGAEPSLKGNVPTVIER